MLNVMNESARGAPERHPRLPHGGAQLADAIRSETRLVVDLIELLWRQRTAVEADDLRTVEDTTFGIQRVLCTLAEAERLREAIHRALGAVESGAAPDLFAVLEPEEAAVLRTERKRLMAMSRVLVREVGMNRALLRVTLGDAACSPC
jgi:hypothetical protein